MIAAVADTHTLHWYLFDDPRLSGSAIEFLDRTQEKGDLVAVSSISLVEITYLMEKKRVPSAVLPRVLDILDDSTTFFVEIPVDSKIAQALIRVKREDVPDMPDRIIAATALHLNVPVISRDSKIKLSDVQTIW